MKVAGVLFLNTFILSLATDFCRNDLCNNLTHIACVSNGVRFCILNIYYKLITKLKYLRISRKVVLKMQNFLL